MRNVLKALLAIAISFKVLELTIVLVNGEPKDSVPHFPATIQIPLSEIRLLTGPVIKWDLAEDLSINFGSKRFAL